MRGEEEDVGFLSTPEKGRSPRVVKKLSSKSSISRSAKTALPRNDRSIRNHPCFPRFVHGVAARLEQERYRETIRRAIRAPSRRARPRRASTHATVEREAAARGPVRAGGGDAHRRVAVHACACPRRCATSAAARRRHCGQEARRRCTCAADLHQAQGASIGDCAAEPGLTTDGASPNGEPRRRDLCVPQAAQAAVIFGLT